MRSFFKMSINIQNIPLMAEIMRRQDELFDEAGAAKSLPADAKRMALGIMQLVNGSGLALAQIQHMKHDSKHVFEKDENVLDHYICVLAGQVMCLLGEECPAMNAGEVWWVAGTDDAILINKSGDDALVLKVVIRVD
mgnify:CR=1 FL=1